MNLTKISNEVYLAPGPIATIGSAQIDLLREVAAASPRKRVRINLHPDASAPLHEMFIAVLQDSYIHPHKHLNKSESFHLVHGEADVVIFNDEGQIAEVIALGPLESGKNIYYRLSAPMFHTLLIHSDILIVHEITNGPFDKKSTIYSNFAPDDSAPTAVIAAWQQELSERVRSRT